MSPMGQSQFLCILLLRERCRSWQPQIAKNGASASTRWARAHSKAYQPIYTFLCEDFLLLQGGLQEPAAPDSEVWRQRFKPLDEGLPEGLPSTPKIPPADNAEDFKVTKPADKGADVAANSGKVDSNVANGNGAAKGQGGANRAAGAGQLAPAKSGKLESKERISSMLQSASTDSAAQQVDSEAKGRKVGCFGRGGQAKESSRPCAIF